MKKKFAAFVLCVICLLSAAGCGQTKTDEQTPPAADQSTTTDDYLTGIGGTYVELFPELSKSEYRNIWIDATAPLVGAENAEATTDLPRIFPQLPDRKAPPCTSPAADPWWPPRSPRLPAV